MVVGGHGHGPLRIQAHTPLVHQTLGPHGEGLSGRQKTIGSAEGPRPSGDRAAGARSEPAELALGQGPEDDHPVGHSRRDGRRPVGDGGRPAGASPAPNHVGVAQLPDAESGGQTGGVVAVAGVRRKAVDIPGIDAGVGAGGQDRLHGQHELRIR